MKPKKIKAMRMWKAANGIFHTSKKLALLSTYNPSPRYILPADAASVERIVKQMVREIYLGSPIPKELSEKLSRAALAAIGIKGGAK